MCCACVFSPLLSYRRTVKEPRVSKPFSVSIEGAKPERRKCQ